VDDCFTRWLATKQLAHLAWIVSSPSPPRNNLREAAKPFCRPYVDSLKQPIVNYFEFTAQLCGVGRRDMQNVSAYAPGGAKGLRSGDVREMASDEILVGRIAAGDQAAVATLFRRHNTRVFRFVTRLITDVAFAEDVVSEVFTEVWRQAGEFEGRSQVSTWILSIARYKALSVRRRRQEVELDELAAGSIPDEADTPEEAMLRSDRGDQLRSCLKELSREHREIVDLVYYHDRTIEEVAEIVNVPKNTVKTRMFYARKRLAQLLAGHQDFEQSIAEIAAAA
jgi:RNA polymerase sigma-70 factor (ECF subfamily)